MTVNGSDARPVVVQKYGGSSLADAEHIHNVADRIQLRRDDGIDVIVVLLYVLRRFDVGSRERLGGLYIV